MNHLKKLLLITFVIFARVESSDAGTQKRLKPKIQRTNKKIVKEVGQIFTTDDQSQIAKEVNDVQLLAQTHEQKKEVAQALQKEIIKQTKEIKNDLEKDNKSIPKYIEYMDALDIIKSKKELSEIKNSSWTNSYIIKPLTKTYRLFLRVWDQKKYTALLEQERKSLEHALNVQAHNNIMLLYVALDLAIKDAALNTEHMFKKENFYKTMIHAFEGGALFASDIQLSNKVKDLITELNMLITQNFEKISTNKAIVQSIWQMNEIFEQLDSQKKPIQTKLRIEKDFKYESLLIKELCVNAANKNGQILVDSKESYAQYLQKWISEPKNVAKVGFVMAAIGGLYIYGPAVPAWLKEYSTSSIGSIKSALSKGYNATISSVKNLWNKLANKKAQEMPDFKENKEKSKRITNLENEIDQGFAFKDERSAQNIENSGYESSWQYYADNLEAERETKAREEQFKKDNEERREKILENDAIATLFDIQKIQTEDAFQENEKARGLQQQGQMLNDFDDEIKSDELAQALAQRNWDADRKKALQAEAIEKAQQTLTDPIERETFDEVEAMAQFKIDNTLNQSAENKRMERFKAEQARALEDINYIKERIAKSSQDNSKISQENKQYWTELLEQSKKEWTEELSNLEKQLEGARERERILNKESFKDLQQQGQMLNNSDLE